MKQTEVTPTSQRISVLNKEFMNFPFGATAELATLIGKSADEALDFAAENLRALNRAVNNYYERSTKQEKELFELKNDVAAMRRILGVAR